MKARFPGRIVGVLYATSDLAYGRWWFALFAGGSSRYCRVVAGQEVDMTGASWTRSRPRRTLDRSRAQLRAWLAVTASAPGSLEWPAWRRCCMPSGVSTPTPHTHDTWTLLIVDDGLIGYELAGHERAATRSGVTLLPPHVVHDGRPVTSRGFRKRVMYLDEQTVGRQYIGAAVDGPLIRDPALRLQVSRLDRALSRHDDLEAESRLAVVVELLTRHLSSRAAPRPLPPPGHVASSARDIFDADPVGMRSVADVATSLGVSTAHLVRAFARGYGIPPHRYILGRRLDLARRRLLAGDDVAQVAFATGFYDQAHLARHFRLLLSTTPGRYQRQRTT